MNKESKERVRLPYQAGAFYASSSASLKAQIEGCFLHNLGPHNLPKVEEKGSRNIIALVNPHAGYMYSGPVAAHSFYALSQDGKPDLIVVLGPNHTGLGSGVSIMTGGVWRMPLGDVAVDSEFAECIQKASKFADVDDVAHKFEHSVEVQLPFLQYLYGNSFKFVPICMLMQDLDVSRDVGKAIVEAASGRNVLIIASTDMTHYEPQNRAESKDKQAIEAILKLDEAQLQSVVESQNITMCGYGPTSVAIIASKSLGATKAQLLCYKTSGDLTNDRSQVVGYASLKIIK
ncbi:MAG: hypothetical protein QG670_2656 [Thermoproteota archaeon]|nr:hypothetical protein [Thermoproteota archaeon]